MRDLNFLRLIAVVGVAVAVGGCATTTTSPAKSVSDLDAKHPRKVTLHTQDSLKSSFGAGKAFVLIRQGSASELWEIVSVTTKPPRVGTGQEVFLVSDDLKNWETTIPRFQDCSKSKSAYSVCSSFLAHKDWLGYANYNAEAVVNAVNSISQDQAKAWMKSYLEAEDAATLATFQQKSKEQAECYASHEAGSREVESAGGKAMALAIAGKPLKPEDLAAIRRAQQRMSASNVCGYNVQPPKMRAALVR